LINKDLNGKTIKKKPYLKNKDLLRELMISKERGELTANAVVMIMKISTKASEKLKYKREDDRKDCIATGIQKCLMYWKNFNPEKSTNAFAYFTQIIKNGFTESFNKLHPISEANLVSISDENIRVF
jgi:hypothetical protein